MPLVEKWISRKLLVALVTIIGLFIFGQYEAAAALASAYVLGQGVVDGLETYSQNKAIGAVNVARVENLPMTPPT